MSNQILTQIPASQTSAHQPSSLSGIVTPELVLLVMLLTLFARVILGPSTPPRN
jgi:hypothetical protein